MKKNPELPITISLEMGDWSHDGHGKTETVVIVSNINKSALEKAYKAGVKITGVDWKNDVADSYEEDWVTEEIVEKLKPHGFKIEEISDLDEPMEGKYGLCTDDYVLGWLFIAQVGNPEFKFEIVEDDRNKIRIGGYGLFY